MGVATAVETFTGYQIGRTRMALRFLNEGRETYSIYEQKKEGECCERHLKGICRIETCPYPAFWVSELIFSAAPTINSGGDCPNSSSLVYGNCELIQPYQGLQPELFFKMSHEIYNYGEHQYECNFVVVPEDGNCINVFCQRSCNAAHIRRLVGKPGASIALEQISDIGGIGQRLYHGRVKVLDSGDYGVAAAVETFTG
ncbi:unnamed protein product [Vicia faba]|nr:unnamed protein product [Vicia faba]